MKQQLFCTNSACKCDLFEVEAIEPTLWRIRQHTGNSWQIAASKPICPRCAMPLEPLEEIEILLDPSLSRPQENKPSIEI